MSHRPPTVALFVTCLNDVLRPETGEAVVRLLRRLGVAVAFPQRQSCCGQLHYNSGYRADARRLMRRHLAAFDGYEAIVTPSGSCAAMVREHYPRLAEGSMAADVGALAARTYELTEFLVDVLGVVDVGAYFPHRVTYHPSCHGLRVLGLGDRPTRLLGAVAGLRLAELADAEECCGFGGTFALKNPAVSTAMGADKARCALNTGAEVLCGADNSCLVHLAGLLHRQRCGMRVLHIAEILAATEARPVRTGASR